MRPSRWASSCRLPNVPETWMATFASGRSSEKLATLDTTTSSSSPSRKAANRSEERRVGKEGRSRWSPYHQKKKRHARRLLAPRRGRRLPTLREPAGGARAEPGGDPGYRSAFFFQAEDGIRRLYVTGVQTCALPILPPPMMAGRQELLHSVLSGLQRGPRR